MSNDAVIILRSNPQLQSTRSYTRTTETVAGSYPLPCVDIFDLAANPVGGNIIYTILNFNDYLGKRIDVNKSVVTAVNKIRIQLPVGKTFSTTASNIFEFDDGVQCVCFTFTQDSVVFTLKGEPGGSSVGTPSSFRANCDPSSNVDPTTNGLLVPMGAAQFNMPITVLPQSVDIADPYINDQDSNFTIGSDTFTINTSGNYEISFYLVVLGSVAKVNPLVAQILRNGQTVFMAPPATSGISQHTSNVGPFGPYSLVWELSGTSNCVLQATDELTLAVLLNNPADDNCIQIVSNISCQKIDNVFTAAIVPPPTSHGFLYGLSAYVPGSPSAVVLGDTTTNTFSLGANRYVAGDGATWFDTATGHITVNITGPYYLNAIVTFLNLNNAGTEQRILSMNDVTAATIVCYMTTSVTGILDLSNQLNQVVYLTAGHVYTVSFSHAVTGAGAMGMLNFPTTTLSLTRL